MKLYTPGETVELNLVLDSGATDQYPLAYVYQGTALETTVSLPHIAGGRYRGVWTPATSGDYLVLFVVYTDAGHTTEAAFSREGERWRPVTAFSPTVADAVLDEALAGHTGSGSVGEALTRLAIIEKINRNRLELVEGAVNNWVLYDDDNVTPFLTWSVSDKDGDGILMDKHIPARRTRGV